MALFLFSVFARLVYATVASFAIYLIDLSVVGKLAWRQKCLPRVLYAILLVDTRGECGIQTPNTHCIHPFSLFWERLLHGKFLFDCSWNWITSTVGLPSGVHFVRVREHFLCTFHFSFDSLFIFHHTWNSTLYFLFWFQERRDDLQVIVGAIGKNPQMPKITPVMMNEIEKVCHFSYCTGNPHAFSLYIFKILNFRLKTIWLLMPIWLSFH